MVQLHEETVVGKVYKNRDKAHCNINVSADRTRLIIEKPTVDEDDIVFDFIDDKIEAKVIRSGLLIRKCDPEDENLCLILSTCKHYTPVYIKLKKPAAGTAEYINKTTETWQTAWETDPALVLFMRAKDTYTLAHQPIKSTSIRKVLKHYNFPIHLVEQILPEKRPFSLEEFRHNFNTNTKRPEIDALFKSLRKY